MHIQNVVRPIECMMSSFPLISVVVNPSTRVLSHNGKNPSIASGAFVAANASVIGDVQLGPGSSVWYGATIRGMSYPRDFNNNKINIS